MRPVALWHTNIGGVRSRYRCLRGYPWDAPAILLLRQLVEAFSHRPFLHPASSRVLAKPVSLTRDLPFVELQSHPSLLRPFDGQRRYEVILPLIGRGSEIFLQHARVPLRYR